MSEVITVKGSPREIGWSYGLQVRDCFADQARTFLEDGLARHGLLDLDRLRAAALRLIDLLPAHYVEEMQGFADAVGLPIVRVAEWHAEYEARRGCSTVVAFVDGEPWVAHNTDYADFGMHRWGCTVVIEADGRTPIMHCSSRGDLFAYQGINRDRLCIITNWLPAPDSPTDASPWFPWLFLVREALETCRTIADVDDLLAAHDRDSGIALTVIDGKTSEAAIFECTCRTHQRLPMDDGHLLVTNHYSSGRSSAESNSHYENSTLRLRRLRELVHLRDTRTLAGFTAILSDPGIERKGEWSGTIQSLVACPGRRETWVSQGAYPAASRGTFREAPWPWRQG